MVNHSGYDVTEYLKVDENKLGFPSLSFNHSKAHPHHPTPLWYHREQTFTNKYNKH